MCFYLSKLLGCRNKSNLLFVSKLQSITPNLSLGTKLLWQADQTKSIVDFVGRYSTNKVVGLILPNIHLVSPAKIREPVFVT
jgi:hypothetical protein